MALGSSIAVDAQALPAGGAQPGKDGLWDPNADAAGVTGGLIGDQLQKTQMYALLYVDLFNILCIPATALLPDTNASAIASAATALCVEQRAFYILDVPQQTNRDTVNGIVDWLGLNATLRSRNAAFYFPRLDIADPLNRFQFRKVAPSGTIAGIYASTDLSRGVWKAPAGTQASLAGVQSLEYNLIAAENGVLNPARNQLRAQLSGLRDHLLGRAHQLRRRPARRRVQIRAGPPARALSRRKPLPRHQMGRVRAQ